MTRKKSTNPTARGTQGEGAGDCPSNGCGIAVRDEGHGQTSLTMPPNCYYFFCRRAMMLLRVDLRTDFVARCQKNNKQNRARLATLVS